MKLLNTATLHMRDFVDLQIPPYCILSHTWGHDEASFSDWMLRGEEPQTSSKAGFAKVARFCETARAQGFQWAWADTCCIDKSNSVELSEAINSMFKWYRDAVACFVYLSDFAGDSKASFANEAFQCRWFGRGWTLQKLVAPENVVFYNRDWSDFGTKKSLAHLLADITNIDVKLLLGERQISEYSIAQRMSWAASRQTTRREDVAYSLLGIFGVTMPMIYGEGSSAFGRLQEAILRQHADSSLLAWKALPDVFSGRGDSSSPRAVLAQYPYEFRDSSRIVQAATDSGRARANEMSAMGNSLTLTLRLLSSQGQTLGVLGCSSIDHPGSRIAILLERVDHDFAVVYRRVSPEVLRNVYISEVDSLPEETVRIEPLSRNVEQPLSRFQQLDISVRQDFNTFPCTLLRSSFTSSQNTSQRMMTYIYRIEGWEGRMTFAVKAQWDEFTERVSAKVEVKDGEEAELRRWALEYIQTASDETEMAIPSNGTRYAVVSVSIRYGVVDSGSQGHTLLFILTVKLRRVMIE